MKALASQISSTLNFGSRPPEGTVATTPSFDLLDPYVRCDKRLSRGEDRLSHGEDRLSRSEDRLSRGEDRLSRGEDRLSRGDDGEDSAVPTDDSYDVDPRRGGDRSPSDRTFSPAMAVLAGAILGGNGGDDGGGDGGGGGRGNE